MSIPKGYSTSFEPSYPETPALDTPTLGAIPECPVQALPADTEKDEPASTNQGWPDPLSELAYHGVAGDVVRAIEPETQADPAAVLIQFLTAVGAACGRGAGFTVDGSRHGVNLFAADRRVTAPPRGRGRRSRRRSRPSSWPTRPSPTRPGSRAARG